MSYHRLKRLIGVLLMLLLAAPLAATAADPMTIEGQVNENYQIVDATGQIYEVADTTAGNELVENHIGEKAKVTGTIELDQDVKIITVTAFTIIAD